MRRPPKRSFAITFLTSPTPCYLVFVVPSTKVLLKQLRQDAEFAGIGVHDGHGRRLDFHSLRVTFSTLLYQAGVHPKTAQQLMRHSDIRTTMDIYTKVGSGDIEASVALLPVI